MHQVESTESTERVMRDGQEVRYNVMEDAGPEKITSNRSWSAC